MTRDTKERDAIRRDAIGRWETPDARRQMPVCSDLNCVNRDS
jgi:hypothetical protein